jgi:ATP-dependent exoDNAse (exonuclease V) beta subunit
MLEASSSVGRVADTLQFLARLHAEIAGKPLFSAVALIVEAISLPERLRLLPAEEFDDLQAELDVLLESAAAAEAEGLSLEEFADLLGANFGTEREAKAPRPGAIQLITCQKAKGLEWDAVIVPFFSRRIHTSEDDFPRIVTAPHSGQPIVAFSKGDVPVETRKELKKAEAQEMERLLYVALTRARHTLVLGVDRELYGAAPSASLTTWLRSDQGQLNQEHVSSLSSAASGCRFTRAAQLAKMPKQTANEKLAPLPEALLPAGRRRGAEFPRRYFPSSFTPTESDTGFDKRKESESEFRAKTVPSAATRYGIWWHELMQRIPWNANRGAWERVFQRMLPNSPDQSRSVREWELLRRNLSSASDFIPLQAIERLILRSEMPFLWSASERQCLEGIIDLALFEPGKNRWFILDWKTNQVMPDEVDKLRAHYRPQLAAYWKAVGEISRNNVEAAIYSTAAGALICYHQDELEAEWNRLLELPPDEIVATVADQERGTAKQLDFADFC